jgi:hypothetical protein
VLELQLCWAEQEYNCGGMDFQESHRMRAASQPRGPRLYHRGNKLCSVLSNRHRRGLEAHTSSKLAEAVDSRRVPRLAATAVDPIASKVSNSQQQSATGRTSNLRPPQTSEISVELFYQAATGPKYYDRRKEKRKSIIDKQKHAPGSVYRCRLQPEPARYLCRLWYKSSTPPDHSPPSTPKGLPV